LFEVNASEDDVAMPASLLTCCRRLIPAGACIVVADAVFEYGPI